MTSSFSCRRPRTQASARPPTPLPISTGPPPEQIQCLSCVGTLPEQRGLACKIQHTPFERPTMTAPNPARNRTIHQSHPEKSKNHRCKNSTTLCDPTYENCCRDASKFHLKETIQDLRNERRARGWIVQNLSETKIAEITDESVGR